jgi:hypothetical protein
MSLVICLAEQWFESDGRPIPDTELAGMHGGQSSPMWCKDATPNNRACENLTSETPKQGPCGWGPQWVFKYRELCNLDYGNEYCSEQEEVSIYDYTSTKCAWKFNGEVWVCELSTTVTPAICCKVIWTDKTACAYTPAPDNCSTASQCAAGVGG